MAFTAFHQVLFFLSLISLPYTLFLSTIIRFRHSDPFSSPFFTICLNLGVYDILALVNGWILIRFPTFDWWGLGDYGRAATGDRLLSKIGVMVSWMCALQQSFAVATLAVNRLTAIVFPHKHEQVWTTKTVGVAIILLWLVPSLLVIPQAWLEFGYGVDNITGEVGFVLWLDHGAQQIYYGIYTPCNTVLNTAVLAVYIGIFWHVKKHMNAVQDISGQANNNRADVKLAFFGFFVFLVMAAYALYALVMAMMPVGDMEAYKRNVMIWTAINDVFSWCNPWLIMLFSAQVRDHMKATAFCKPLNFAQPTNRHPSNQQTGIQAALQELLLATLSRKLPECRLIT